MAGVQKLTVRTGQKRLFTRALHAMRSVGGLFDEYKRAEIVIFYISKSERFTVDKSMNLY